MPFYEQPVEDRPPQTVTQRVEHYSSPHREWFAWEGGPLLAYFTFDDVPEPMGDVVVTIEVTGQLDDVQNVNALRLFMWNFGFIAQDLFLTSGTNCPGTNNPNVEQVVVSKNDWITLAAAAGSEFEGQIVLNIFQNIGSNIDPQFCVTVNQPHNFFRVRVGFEFDYAVDDVEPLDLKMWGEDLCQNAVFTPTFIEGSPYPKLQTVHRVRVMAQSPSADVEPCLPHTGELVIDEDGYARGFYCSRPIPFVVVDEQQNHYADLFIVQDNDDVLRNTLEIPKGYGVFVGAYAAPRWTELQLWSHVEICGGQL